MNLPKKTIISLATMTLVLTLIISINLNQDADEKKLIITHDTPDINQINANTYDNIGPYNNIFNLTTDENRGIRIYKVWRAFNRLDLESLRK